uniref:Uncharacterized protein n=1 Tax=uncultured Bacteroidota bacterium TaxID=152509 RepID=H5SGK7_9BACT|nr:hypothetical protein HGMM_F25B04C36 [uncultured Bacteroidetes bacterium]
MQGHKVFWVAFPLFAQIQLSQNPVSGDCRLSSDSLRPLIPPHFPYLYQYAWDPVRKLETVWLSPTLKLQIEQRACLRHHITYELRVPPGYPFPTGLTRGLMSLLDTVLTLLHREDFAFLALKATIWPKLMSQAALRSLGDVVMLSYQEWSFLLQLDQDKQGPVVRLETIRYLSSQAIQRPGVPDYMDDGWGP